MKAFSPEPHILVIAGERLYARLFGGASFLCAVFAAYAFITHAGSIQENVYYGPMMAAALLGLMGVLTQDSFDFSFDRRQRVLRWQTRRFFSRHSGTLGFDMIRSVEVQNLSDADEGSSARPILHTRTGDLPLGRSYSGNTPHVEAVVALLHQWVFSAEPLESPSLESGDKETLLGITALITLVCGPIFLGFGLHGVVQGVRTFDWNPVVATIIDSGMHRDIEEDEHQFWVSYRYIVDGNDYISGRIYVKPLINSRLSYPTIRKLHTRTQDVVRPKDYRSGMKVMAYYCPGDPSLAVLIRGASGSSWVLTIFGAIFVLLYLWLARRDLQRRRRKRA